MYTINIENDVAEMKTHTICAFAFYSFHVVTFLNEWPGTYISLRHTEA